MQSILSTHHKAHNSPTNNGGYSGTECIGWTKANLIYLLTPDFVEPRRIHGCLLFASSFIRVSMMCKENIE